MTARKDRKGRTNAPGPCDRELAKGLLDRLQEAVYRMTLPGGRYEYVNRAAGRVFGVAPERFLSTPMLIRKLVHPDFLPFFEESFARLCRGEVPPTFEYKIIDPAGRERWISQTNTGIFDPDGAIVAIEGCCNDITERKRVEEEKLLLEAQLRQAQKMEAIGTLAGGIAHDFNNILSAIYGYTELSLLDLPEGSEFRGNLVKILESADRARDLVQQILAFSRQGEQDLAPIALSSLIKETVKFIRASLPATIEVRQRIETDAKAAADPAQVHQLLMNLFTNAAHAMQEEGGILTVTLSELEIDSGFFASQPDLSVGPYLQLTVGDTGCGMDRGVRERIFDPFFTTKTQPEGTGLGLSVAHGIVKGHGGAITVESTPGRGTLVSVYLPVVEAAAAAPEAPDARMPSGRERILFVDDEEFQVDIARQMLRRIGYRVSAYSGARKALARFRSDPRQFDLVITDMVMPEMTGDALSRELLALRPDIPVILCTGYSDRLTREKAQSIGITGFIVKPFIMKEIAAEIRRVLSG